MRYKICRKPDCDAKIPYTQENPYCAVHAGMYHKRSAYTRSNDKRRVKYYNRYQRDQEANQFYKSKRWIHLAKQLKRERYFTCECCGHTFDKPNALVTDHIIPRRIDKRKQWDVNNLWVICQWCHYWKTQLENKVYKSQSLIVNLDTAKLS